MLSGMRGAMTVLVMALALLDWGGSQAETALKMGDALAEPEALSGVWISPDGRHGYVQVTSRVQVTVPVGGSLERGPFRTTQIDVGVCQSGEVTAHPGECSFSSTEPDAVWGSRLAMGKDFLRIREAGVPPVGAPMWARPRVQSNLVLDRGDWVGTLERADWSGTVRLGRGQPGGLTGTFRSVHRRNGRVPARSDPFERCLHLAEGGAGLVASIDWLHEPGYVRQVHGEPVWQGDETFGLYVGVERDPTGFLTFTVDPLAAGVAGRIDILWCGRS